jgi:hypothetical protein
MRLTTDFIRGVSIGVGVVTVAAIATLRGAPQAWIRRLEGRGERARSALERAARRAQQAPDYLDVFRAAGV